MTIYFDFFQYAIDIIAVSYLLYKIYDWLINRKNKREIDFLLEKIEDKSLALHEQADALMKKFLTDLDQLEKK